MVNDNQMKNGNNDCSILSIINEDEGDTKKIPSKTMKEKQRETKMEPMAMAFNPLSSRYSIVNNAIPPTNAIRRGALIGTSTTADGGKAQPIREKLACKMH